MKPGILRGIGLVVLSGAFISLVAACGSRSFSSGLTLLSVGDDPLTRGLAEITEEALRKNLEIIASEEYGGRGTGYDGEERAAEFIEGKFAEFGIVPGYGDSYRQRFSVNRGRGYAWNIVGYLPGNDPELKDEVVVIGGHYDHLGKRYGSIYYGADDNGSGTVAVIEAARAFAAIKDSIKRTIVFITFSGEEIGLVGSNYYVRNPLFSRDNTIYMVNLDMVGWLRSGKLKFLGGGSSSYMSDLINDVGERYPDVDPYITSSAGGGSDHVPFIRYDIPAVFLHTGTTDVYHTPRDTVEKINYAGMTDAAKIGFELVWHLSDKEGRDNVEWIKPEETPEWNLDHGLTPFID